MPCNSDYMEPHARERDLSRVACLMDELNGRAWSPHEWQGFHPRVYGHAITTKEADAMVADLCARLQSVHVPGYSLEMQIWWRDHQRADAQRLERELAAAKDADERAAALAKLTPHERKLLGL